MATRNFCAGSSVAPRKFKWITREPTGFVKSISYDTPSATSALYPGNFNASPLDAGHAG